MQPMEDWDWHKALLRTFPKNFGRLGRFHADLLSKKSKSKLFRETLL